MTINTQDNKHKGILFGMGNPLLDIISTFNDKQVLERYGLKANDAILAEEKHMPLYEEISKRPDVVYVAGGATQNAIRGAQWMLPPHSTVYVGCVGKDAFAENLRKAAEDDGVQVEYMIDETTPSGTCAVVVTDENRSMVANVAAANNFKLAHLQTPKVSALIEQAKYFYIEGYFLTHGVESVLYLAEHAKHNGKLFTMNISAPFLCQFFKEQMEKVVPYWDIIFGNESEARAFAQAFGFGTDNIEEIGQKIAALPKHTSRPRMVVITQGADATCVTYDGKTQCFPVIPVKTENIIDSTGAGDAFCGGFFSGLVQDKPLEECIARAHYAASVIIQRNGPTYPREKPTMKF